MASRVVMPKLSDTMEEGKILRWLRKEGDKVETGQTLAEVETDKATVEMEAYTNGTLRKLVAKDGDTIKVGDLIAVIGAPPFAWSFPLTRRPARITCLISSSENISRIQATACSSPNSRTRKMVYSGWERGSNCSHITSQDSGCKF